MTKAELLEALADLPGDAEFYIDPGDGVLRSKVSVSIEEDGGLIVFSWIDDEEDDHREPHTQGDAP